MKLSALDRAIAKINADIAQLETVKAKLIEYSARDTEPVAAPKPRKTHKKKGLPASSETV